MEPPPSGTLLMNNYINVLQNGRVGLGVIFRDEKRVVVFACKTELRVARSTTLMEGIAIQGLHGDVDLDPYSEVVKDDILTIARRVDVIDFQFIPIASNRVAHLLSRSPNFIRVNFIP
ncbi:hypothetical protein SASPL_143663 [Salvia splendens]|uniref:Uncharacterized protein n=1 Tax=Salvia splendens TaxID=180675 RepID=A0A8X8WMG7_SALSN|nr:hypothetical protein SASPL_143663 [Salvia splendens]